MDTFTTPELLACIARELARRESAYPGWDGFLRKELTTDQRKEIDMMRTVYNALEVLRDISPQPYTFDSPVEGTPVLVYLANQPYPRYARRIGLNDWDFEGTFSEHDDAELSKQVIAFSYLPALPRPKPTTDETTN